MLFRLMAAAVLTVGLVSAFGYEVIVKSATASHLKQSAATQRADVRALGNLSAGRTGDGLPTSRVRDVLRVMAERPGVRQVLLIDDNYKIRVSGRQPASEANPLSDRDSRITAALQTGARYAGHETDPGQDTKNFEFVSPVEILGRRYALTAVYGHGFHDETLTAVRRSLGIVLLLGLLGGGAVFYLVGGRALLRSHRQALRRATRDGLTDLPNHRAFQDDIEQAVESAARYHEPLTLAVMDVDGFKRINDKYGHPYGDAVLRRVADVLGAGRVGDRAYRLGGDEFALLLPRADEAGACRIAARLSRSLNAAETEVCVGLSNLRSGQSAEDLREETDAALYEAKRRGGNRVAHFNEIRDLVTLTTSTKSDALRRLIEEDGITSVYQPIWDIDAGVLLGVEALMRPDAGYEIGGPEAAFDIAVKIGEVHRLDELCVRTALQIVPDLPEQTLLFINLAPQTLALDGPGSDWLLKAVEHAGIAPSQVVIELTERFAGRTDSIIEALKRLRKQGFRVALDDVGTGNSGLEVLRQVQAEFVKIDRSIVTAAVAEPTARAVLMAMATYASQTDSLVIAEGIEDQETLDFLGQIDTQGRGTQRIVTGGQGYGLGRPGPDIPLEAPAIVKPRPLYAPVTPVALRGTRSLVLTSGGP